MKYVVTDEDVVASCFAYMKDDTVIKGWEPSIADKRRMRAALESFAQTLGEPVDVPDGWVLVPVEPTEEMLEQATTHDLNKRTAETDQWNRDTWSFMLSAAPNHPTTEKGCE